VWKVQVDLTTVSTLIGLGSIIIGVFVSLHTIRRLAKDRNLSIFLEFHKILYDKEFIQEMNEIQTLTWEHVGEFFVKYGPEPNPEAFAKWVRVGSYFDGLSTLVERKFMDVDMISESTAVMLIRHWELIQPTADQFAMVYKRPNCNDSIKYLYDRLQKIDYQYDREGYEKLLKEYTEKKELEGK
jgi:hypothetical protein